MRQIHLNIEEAVPNKDCWLLLPRPFADGVQSFANFSASDIRHMQEISALNSEQTAYLLKPSTSQAPALQYTFIEGATYRAPWLWQMNDNRYTCASDELREEAQQIKAASTSQSHAIAQLMHHAADIFGYGHVDERFNDGLDEVPLLCGTAKGSCVDMNTYLLAAARCMDINVQYIAGYWFHPEKTSTLDMHCWLIFALDGETVFWDLAHHLKWGVEKLGPGLNPAGGRRVPMSCGRGLAFSTPYGNIEISHFSEPLWLMPDGTMHKAKLTIHISE